jgi:glycosyltransferase involved in cell wall biosynthesis
MKVLLQIRPDFENNVAGDSIQLLNTKKCLEQLGLDVDISVNTNAYLETYDVVHIFNTTRIAETYNFVLNALQQRKPIALSTIYWDVSEYYNNTRSPKSKLEIWNRAYPLRKYAMDKADILLPNSMAEMQLIKERYGVNTTYEIVPNGADADFAKADASDFVNAHAIYNFVLCVGRLSPRKNQLALIKAMRDIDIPLVLIGSVSDGRYAQKCLSAGNKVYYMPFMPQQKLASAYAAAKVHAQPSFFETPGLASLEAAMAGCNIVITDRGGTNEYFNDMAWYCNPNDINSIEAALLDALSVPKSKRLSEHVLSHFTWDKAAQKTSEAYNKILK